MTYLYSNAAEREGSKLLSTMLVQDTWHFKNFTRMDPSDFELLLNLIGPIIKKPDTSYRPSICPKDRLLLTLRFLATGDSYTSLQYLFKISKQFKVIEIC